MPCFAPRQAWASATQKNPKSGKRYIAFRPTQWVGGTEEIKVHCGTCDGCRIERSRQWAVRCWHEASLHKDNVFITLTFDEETLDPQGSLRKPDFQKFMKRLRKHFYGDTKSNIRYFHCGEYGERRGRPHHHACLFNFTFPDLEIKRKTASGNFVYTSEILKKLWPDGIHEIGSVTFKSAAYVSRYILKKQKAIEWWTEGKQQKEQEYVTMSRRPAIAKDWLKKFQSDVYPGDFVALEGGYKCLPPKYYDKQYEIDNPENYAILKKLRVDRAKENPDNMPDRMVVRHELLKRKLKLLKRGYENESEN